MTQKTLYFAVAMGLTLGSTGPASAQPAVPAATAASTAPFVTTNRVIQASLERLSKRSALWRGAADAVAATGRRAVILTADQVVVAVAPEARRTEPFDATVLAEVAPIPRADSRIEVVVVVINLRLLEDQHRARYSVPAEFEADLDRILVHEVYGHAVPYLLAGDASGRCADPQPGDRVFDACSIRRENAVRAELGLGRRTEYGLEGLALTRRH